MAAKERQKKRFARSKESEERVKWLSQPYYTLTGENYVKPWNGSEEGDAWIVSQQRPSSSRRRRSGSWASPGAVWAAVWATVRGSTTVRQRLVSKPSHRAMTRERGIPAPRRWDEPTRASGFAAAERTDRVQRPLEADEALLLLHIRPMVPSAIPTSKATRRDELLATRSMQRRRIHLMVRYLYPQGCDVQCNTRWALHPAACSHASHVLPDGQFGSWCLTGPSPRQRCFRVSRMIPI